MSEDSQAPKNQGSPAPDFVAAKGRVKDLGAQIGGHAPSVGSLAEKTGAIQVEFPYFSVAGSRAYMAHNDARDSAVKALNAGKAVLESWQAALTQTEKNYQAADAGAEETIDDKTKSKGLGGGAQQAGLNGLGPLDASRFPSSGPETPEFPDSNMNAPELPDSSTKTTEFPGPNVNTPEFPDLSTKTPEFPDSNVNTPEIPGMPKPDDLANGGPGADLSGLDRDALGDSLSDRDRAGLGDGLGLPDPRQTDLSAYNPSNLPNSLNLPNIPNSLNQPNVPTPQPNAPDPRTFLGDQAGAGSSTRAGGSSGGLSNIGGPALNAARAAGTNGMPFMPPMMGGGAPGGEQKNKEASSIALSEDESVWGGDEGISPAVLGQEA